MVAQELDFTQETNEDTDLETILSQIADRAVVPANLTQELNIDPANIEQEMVLQPYLYANYALLHADAVSAHDNAKQTLDLIYSELDGTVRGNLLDQGVKVTDKVADAAIKSHDDYVQALWTKQRAYQQMLICEGIRRAFEQRLTMLQMIAASRNAIMKGTP